MTEDQSAGNLGPYPVAVIMERVQVNHRWASERWSAIGIVPDAAPDAVQECGAGRVILRDEKVTRILFPGFVLRLHPDEAEGYLYNVTSPQPKVFVMWRMRDDIARPERLTVSYHEGARWMDSEECVDGVPLPPDLAPWIAEFGRAHYKPEEKNKKRYASSRDKGVASHRDGTS